MPHDTRMIRGCQYLLANLQADDITRNYVGSLVK
jgi:hypothetical protein